ncbi:MAG: GNAT family N-acetyltransferase [Promethearchaeota archaeon]
MVSEFFKIKPYDDSLGFSIFADLYQKMSEYVNPETTFQVTEEIVPMFLGKETVLSRDFLLFENNKGENVALAGISNVPIYKDAWVAVYAVLPEYFQSNLPGELIDAVLDLGKKLHAPELLFQTYGEKLASFDEKLEKNGFNPVNFHWSMRLDNFNLFSPSEIPQDIDIQYVKDVKDYSILITIINKAFQDSFKFEPYDETKWKKMQEVLKQDHVIEHCIAYKGNNIIGFCDTIINPKQDQIGQIGSLCVLPEYQHRRIGSAILASGIKLLREKGCKVIKLSVDTENEKALGLYKKFGFYVNNNLTQKTYQII